MHLNDHDLGTHLAGTASAESVFTHEHLAQCAACREAVQWARATDDRISTLLHVLDHAAPPVTFAMIEARATAPRPVGARVEALAARARSRLAADRPASRSGRRPVHRLSLPWSVVGLAFAAAAAAAIPASPMHHFLTSLVGGQAGRSQAARSASPPVRDVPPSTGAPAAPRGLAIVPRSGQVVLVWRARQSVGAIEVRVAPVRSSPGARVSLLASGDGAAYAISHDTILVDNRSAPGLNFEVQLPPASELARVALLIGDRVVFSRRGDVIDTRAARTPDGGYSIALAPDHAP